MNAYSNSAPLRVSGTLRLMWSLVRVPLLGLLILLAPLVESVCGALLLLGVLMSIAFKISSAANFPFWTVIALSLGFGIFVILDHVVLGMLSR